MEVEDSTMKCLIELSSTEEEANSIIEKFRPDFSYRQKYELLCRLFKNISILGGCDGEGADSDKTDYQAVLAAAVNLKWR